MSRSSKVLALFGCLTFVFFLCAISLAAEAEPKVGNNVGNPKFTKPMSDEDAKYLGLDKAGDFSLKDVKAPFVLVEQFSTGCPHCMHQAPVLNNLFAMVQQDPKLKEKIKFLAVGQGDAADKLMLWKAFHKVPFPLIPDVDSAFGKALNFSPYPVTVILDKTGKILVVHIGAFESADEVLKDIKKVVK